MATDVSAQNSLEFKHEFAADERQHLARVIRDNLEGDGCCPLDYLVSTKDSIRGLMAYLLEHHSLPEPVALDLREALACAETLEVLLRRAATRCV